MSVGTAAAFAPSLVEAIWNDLSVDFVHMYGSSEGVGVATTDREDIRLGSVGRPPADSTRIVAADREELPTGEIGEIAFSRKVYPVTYWQPSPSDDPDRSEWFYSGDLGRLDEQGRLYVFGRLKHQIDRGGLKIDPVEVERALLKCPEVADAAVMGIPDPILGEAVCACVVPEDGAAHDARRRARPARHGARRLQTAGGASDPRQHSPHATWKDRSGKAASKMLRPDGTAVVASPDSLAQEVYRDRVRQVLGETHTNSCPELAIAVDVPGGDAGVQAISGLMAVHGRDDGRPRRLGLEVPSVAAGILASQGAIAGALARLRGMPIRRVDTSLVAGALAFLHHHLALDTCGNDLPFRQPPPSPGPPFRTRDAHLIEIEALLGADWTRFWGRLGVPDTVAVRCVAPLRVQIPHRPLRAPERSARGRRAAYVDGSA